MLLISNPSSGSSDEAILERVAEVLGGREPVRRVEPSSVETFDAEVGDAATGERIVVVAGGDGTLNHAINALVDRRDDLHFGLIPMGTGNDLARTLSIPADPIDAAEVLVEARPATIDVGIASGAGGERYFVNACMGGFPVRVNQAIDEGEKERLGPVAFLWGGVKALSDLQRWTVVVGDAEVADCVAAGVGNGRTAGGGIEVWPDADPDDGLFDVYALPAANALETLQLGAKVRSGRHDEMEQVTFARVASVRIEASPEMEFNVDGELVGLRTPAAFEVFGKLWMLRPGA